MAALRGFGVGTYFLGRSKETSLSKTEKGLVLECKHSLITATQVIERRPNSLCVIGVPFSTGFSQATIQSAGVCCRAASQSNSSEADKPLDKHSHAVPNAFQVESLLLEICETSIAEFELKLKDFKLYVRRDIKEMDLTSPPITHPPLATGGKTESLNSSMPVTQPAPGSLEPAVSSALTLFNQINMQNLLDTADDGGMHIVTSPKVGIFRRARQRKGKRGPPMCQEGRPIRVGQVVCYVEQIGVQTPVESKVAGEVVSILKKDGEPVGYGDPLISVLPSFPGIKKLN